MFCEVVDRVSCLTSEFAQLVGSHGLGKLWQAQRCITQISLQEKRCSSVARSSVSWQLPVSIFRICLRIILWAKDMLLLFSRPWPTTSARWETEPGSFCPMGTSSEGQSWFYSFPAGHPTHFQIKLWGFSCTVLLLPLCYFLQMLSPTNLLHSWLQINESYRDSFIHRHTHT